MLPPAKGMNKKNVKDGITWIMKHGNNIFIYIDKDTKGIIITLNNILSKKACNHIHSNKQRHFEVAWSKGNY